MSEQETQGFFTKFIARSGEKCIVNKTFFQGELKDGDVFWNMQCTNGKQWSLLLKNDVQGSTKIIDCKSLKALNASECFKPFRK